MFMSYVIQSNGGEEYLCTIQSTQPFFPSVVCFLEKCKYVFVDSASIILVII